LHKTKRYEDMNCIFGIIEYKTIAQTFHYKSWIKKLNFK